MFEGFLEAYMSIPQRIGALYPAHELTVYQIDDTNH